MPFVARRIVMTTATMAVAALLSAGPTFASTAGPTFAVNGSPLNATAVPSADKWSKWYTIDAGRGRIFKCRNYVSATGGSPKLKFRVYSECNKRSDINVQVLLKMNKTMVKAGKARVCIAKWCDRVAYVNNRKGVQTWCATNYPIINSNRVETYRNLVRVCIKY